MAWKTVKAKCVSIFLTPRTKAEVLGSLDEQQGPCCTVCCSPDSLHMPAPGCWALLIPPLSKVHLLIELPVTLRFTESDLALERAT